MHGYRVQAKLEHIGKRRASLLNSVLCFKYSPSRNVLFSYLFWTSLPLLSHVMVSPLPISVSVSLILLLPTLTLILSLTFTLTFINAWYTPWYLYNGYLFTRILTKVFEPVGNIFNILNRPKELLKLFLLAWWSVINLVATSMKWEEEGGRRKRERKEKAGVSAGLRRTRCCSLASKRIDSKGSSAASRGGGVSGGEFPRAASPLDSFFFFLWCFFFFFLWFWKDWWIHNRASNKDESAITERRITKIE